MPIETGPRAGELLFRVIGEEARALTFGDRLKLFGILKEEASRFDLLPPNLRAVFERAEQRVRGR